MPSPTAQHAGSCTLGSLPSRRRPCIWEVRPWLLIALLLACPGWASSFMSSGLVQLRHTSAAQSSLRCRTGHGWKIPRRQRAPQLSALDASAAQAQRAQTGEGAEWKGRRDSDVARSAYIHIPFCQQRCFYCDFPVKVEHPTLRPSSQSPYPLNPAHHTEQVVGRSPQEGRAVDTIEGYLASLHEEIRRGGGGGFDQEVF